MSLSLPGSCVASVVALVASHLFCLTATGAPDYGVYHPGDCARYFSIPVASGPLNPANCASSSNLPAWAQGAENNRGTSLGGGEDRDTVIRVTARGIALPEDFEDAILSASAYMHKAWQQLLGQRTPNPAAIELVLLADLIDFETAKKYLAPELPNVSGFYSSASNQAVVRYDARNMEVTRRTAIHEMSHLVTQAQLGPAPLWLAEGIAEYFEAIEFTGSGPVIQPNARHQPHLAAIELPPLDVFFQMSPQQWQSEEGIRNYAVAWSFVYFLMKDSEGRLALGSLLSQMNSQVCQYLPLELILGRSYPGGFQQLESDWRLWVGSGAYAARH